MTSDRGFGMTSEPIAIIARPADQVPTLIDPRVRYADRRASVAYTITFESPAPPETGAETGGR